MNGVDGFKTLVSTWPKKTFLSCLYISSDTSSKFIVRFTIGLGVQISKFCISSCDIIYAISKMEMESRLLWISRNF